VFAPFGSSSSHLIWLILTLYRVSPIILNEHSPLLKARKTLS
jgi:hypothetical protein